MADDNEFLKALMKGNARTRIVLKDRIRLVAFNIIDEKDFIENLRVAKNNHFDFDEHDGDTFDYDREKKDIFNQQMAALHWNFSEERLDYLFNIAKELRLKRLSLWERIKRIFG